MQSQLKAAEEAARAAGREADELRRELEEARRRGKLTEQQMEEMRRQLEMTGDLNDRMEVRLASRPAYDSRQAPLPLCHLKAIPLAADEPQRHVIP